MRSSIVDCDGTRHHHTDHNVPRFFCRDIVSKMKKVNKKRKSDGSMSSLDSTLLKFPYMCIGQEHDIAGNLDHAFLKAKRSQYVSKYLIRCLDSPSKITTTISRLMSLMSTAKYESLPVLQALQGICRANLFYITLVIDISAACEGQTSDEKQEQDLRSLYQQMLQALEYVNQIHRMIRCHPKIQQNGIEISTLISYSTWMEAVIKDRKPEMANIEKKILLKLFEWICDEVSVLAAPDRAMPTIPMIEHAPITQSGAMKGIFQSINDQRNDQKDTLSEPALEIFMKIFKSTKELFSIPQGEHLYHTAALAGCFSEILRIVARDTESSCRKYLLHSVPDVYEGCIQGIASMLMAWDDTMVLSISEMVHFVERYVEIASWSKPRMSWEGYSSLFSSLVWILHLCPVSIGESHASRPNAPKEAMILSASGFNAIGNVRRLFLRSIGALLNASTRVECTNILQLILHHCDTSYVPWKSSLLEVLMLMLEDEGNGVLKDLLRNKVDSLVVSLLHAAHSHKTMVPCIGKDSPLHIGLQTIARDTLEAPSNVKKNNVSASHGEIDGNLLDAATCARCLESIICRPSRFKKLPKRFIAMILTAVYTIADNRLIKYTGQELEYNACFTGLCHLTAGIIRHHADTIPRNMHLLGMAIISLQTSLAKLCMQEHTPSNHIVEMLCRLVEQYATCRAVQQYGKDIIMTHVKCFMCPHIPASTSQGKGYTVPIETQNALLPGICALYGVCSPNDVQDMYASLDKEAVWKSALKDLKMTYESRFRYVGKV